MTITEHVAKFNKLGHFAPTIMPSDDVCNRKFILGLKMDVAKQINSGSHNPETFIDVVPRALRNKSWDKDEPRMAPSRDKRAVVPADRSMFSENKRLFKTLVGSLWSSE